MPEGDAVKITATDDGPYLVEGPARVVDADGNEFRAPGSKIWLCRCGGSANKPFCDGSHKGIGFEAADRGD